MRRIGFIGLAVIAMCTLNGVTASSSLTMECRQVREAGTGVYNDSQCVIEGGTKNWVKVLGHTKYLGDGIWCVETELNKGNRTDPQCNIKGVGKYIEVFQPGPNWHVGGSQLKQGAKQIKLQSKGGLILKQATLAVEIECKNSISEGATIEGQGVKGQGQGKGRVTYSQCTVLKPVGKEGLCTIAEPTTTNQLKSHLAFASTQTKIVSLFEPTNGPIFMVLKFSKACGSVLEGERGINGAIAGEIIPVGGEAQEGLMAFPTIPISRVLYEGQERRPKFEFAGFAATFSCVYGARLATFPEKFGVFDH